MQAYLQDLSTRLKGNFYYNQTAAHQVQLMAYATDASVYEEKPLAVCLPLDAADIQTLISFAQQHAITLIPRAAGTSLAGQVVGNGIVVDISRHFNSIIEINEKEQWVRVQPGVIRDDLNKVLKPFGLMFGPETSTANRAMIGGMVGNNSCGLHSIVWGDVRTNLLEVTALLSDGTQVVFNEQHPHNVSGNHFLQSIYSSIDSLLSNPENQQLIQAHFPKTSVVRRNTGYALDALLGMQPYSMDGHAFNLCSLIAGSEGTLVFITEVKLQLMALPPGEIAMVCVHTSSIDAALRANIIALQHKPMASELVDRYIMNFTLQHPEYSKNCFFIEGDPAALLMVEFMAETAGNANDAANNFIADCKQQGYGYAFPVLYNTDTTYAWEVRKAGLGLLRNMPGDTQPVNLIEDCAVSPQELPDYINDLQQVLHKHHVTASYYAHAGAGELHVEPMINLKTSEGVRTFRNVLADTVELIKKYNGSLSGEHGDGRLRGEFIATVVGSKTYLLFEAVKNIFDPNNIFNKGKITGAPPMDSHLRVSHNDRPNNIETHFRFSNEGGMLRLAEKCSGSGDCRKSEMSGGTMCPSYMATRNEKDTTRARANVLRQFLTHDVSDHPLNHDEINEVMDLCISCKGCKSECPSGVDIAKMKAEFLQHYYDKNGVPFRSKLIGNFSQQMKLASKLPWVYNVIFKTNLLRKVANKLVGFHPERTMPVLANTTLLHWFNTRTVPIKTFTKSLYFFCDEFTNYLDVAIGKKAILLLEGLGYEVIIPQHNESGRSFLSKGFIKKAKTIANANIVALAPLVTAVIPIVGIEPSAILTLRDEYIDLADEPNRMAAAHLANHTFTIEEFIAAEEGKGNITKQQFTSDKKLIALHGHCYQKSLSSQHYSNAMLSLPVNYQVTVIPSGCCGMAGSFGYEAEHYAISQQIGELVLFPAVRKLTDAVIIAAAGTSCRHQIKDGTHRVAQHPVEILYDALLP